MQTSDSYANSFTFNQLVCLFRHDLFTTSTTFHILVVRFNDMLTAHVCNSFPVLAQL